MFKFSVLQRMTLTALLFALSVIATRYIGVYVTPYVRLSAGVAITTFSSILLGPISGAIIGGVGDIIGILIVPVSGVDINPFITLTYTLMGATPGLIMMLFRHFKKKDLIYSISFFVLLLAILVSLTVYMSISPDIEMFNHVFKINLVARIVVPIVAFVLMVALAFFTYFLNRRFKKRREEYPNLPSPYQVSFIVVFIEVFFTLLLNTLVKAYFYEVDFSIIFFPHLFLAFIYIPANTLIVTYLCFLAVKVIKVRE